MTALNSEGLEKAFDILWAATEWNDGWHACRETVGAAIAAYLDALPPVDGLEVVAWDVAPKGLPAEPTKSHSFVAEIEKQGGVISPLVTLSQASSVIAGLTAERDEARRGEYAANEHEPTWDEITSAWKARAETAEQEAKALLDALNQVGLTPEQKSWVESFLKTRALLAARQALEDHNG